MLKKNCIGLQWCGSTTISCTSTIPAPGWMACGCAVSRKSNRPWAAGCWTTKTVRRRFSLVKEEERVASLDWSTEMHNSAGSIHRVHVQTVSAEGVQEAPPSHSNRGDTHAGPHISALMLLTGTSAGLTQPLLQEAPSRLLPPQPPEPQGPSVGLTVIAEYNYQPKTSQDLELRKDEEYTILEMSDPNWWRAKDKYGWVTWRENSRRLWDKGQKSQRQFTFFLHVSERHSNEQQVGVGRTEIQTPSFIRGCWYNELCFSQQEHWIKLMLITPVWPWRILEIVHWTWGLFPAAEWRDTYQVITSSKLEMDSKDLSK